MHTFESYLTGPDLETVRWTHLRVTSALLQ